MTQKFLLWQSFSVANYSSPDPRRPEKQLYATLTSRGEAFESPYEAWEDAQRLLDGAERFIKSESGNKISDAVCGICPAGMV